jgi:hypothetical protein
MARAPASFRRAHGPPYATRHYNFRAYRDYLASHPSGALLPVYITETDQVWA